MNTKSQTIEVDQRTAAVLEARAAARGLSVSELLADLVGNREALRTNAVEDWQRFRMLTENWRKERGITSSVSKMALCPSYQRIIAMGDKAVPLILRTLKDEGDDPDHWFWALEMITGENPVPVQAYGNTVQMAQAWLGWAKGRYAW